MMNFFKIISIVRCGVIEIILPFVLSILLLGACEGASEPVGLTELRRIAGSEGIDEAGDYLAGLPSQSRMEVAHFAAVDADPGISALGINALVKSGYLDEAVPALSARVAGGDDLTAFGYAWAHGDDPQLPIRMYLKICRYQLAKLDSFDATQRMRVERFLSDGGYINPLTEFSSEAAEHRLMLIEARLRESGH